MIALILDVRDTVLIELSGMCPVFLMPVSDRISSPRCQGQIAYKPI